MKVASVCVTWTSFGLQWNYKKTEGDNEAYYNNFCGSCTRILFGSIISNSLINQGATSFFRMVVFLLHSVPMMPTKSTKTYSIVHTFVRWIFRPAFFLPLISHILRTSTQAFQPKHCWMLGFLWRVMESAPFHFTNIMIQR